MTVAAVEQEYAKLRAQYQGSTDALIALDKWRDQSINNAGRQAAFDRDQEAAKEAEAAAKRATDEAQRYAEATRSRIAGIDQSVAAQRMEIDLLGRSEGEAAALRFEFQALAAARQAAASAGKVVSDEELAAIQRAAGEVGTLTAQFKEMQEAQEQAKRLGEMFDDLAFERSIIGLSEAEQRVRESIHGLGVDYESLDGQRLAGEMCYNDALRKTQDEMRKTGEIAEDAFGGLIDALTQGGDLMQNLMGFAADLGRQFASMGAQKLFGNLFGTGQGSGGAQGSGIAGAILSAVGGGRVPTPTPRPATLSASYAYSEKYALPSPTPAMRAQSAALAQGVTKSVSSNLLSSLLGAGKSQGHISGLNDRFATALTSMLDAAPAAVQSAITINSGFRSVARQAELFDAALKKYGSVAAARKWVAPPGNSQHNKGMAADLGYGSSSAREWIHANAGKYGLAFPLGNENWHIELAGARGGSKSATAAYNDQRIVARGVSDGMKDYSRDASVAQPQHSAGPATESAGGFFSPRALAGIEVIGAGVGAFGAGYQSGSPISGGISGALGGYQAAGSIASAFPGLAGVAGPIGAIGGAALGILGGILGARKQREQAHRDKAAKWEELRPQYEAFDKSLSGDGNGQLRQWITAQESQFAEFRKVGGDAWKYGQGNSSAQFASTGTKMWTRFMEMQEEFREGFTDMVEDLSSGEGLGGAFAKGRAATKDLKKQIKDMIDDVSIAFGSDDIGVGVNGAWTEASKAMEEARNKAIAEAKTAAGEYALSLLYTAATTSDVEKSLDGFRGTAAGLQKVLTDLGWTAEAAAADIDDRLGQAIAKMGETFNEGFQAQINDLSGVGYFNDVKDLLTSRDTALNDAKLLGVDPEIVSRWFKLASQDLVDGSELVGSEFDDLIKAFPELSGVVHAFTGASRTAAEAAKAAQSAALASYEASRSQLESVYSAVLSYRDGIRSFLDDMKLGDGSTLSQKDQVAEARRVYEETLAKANGGDKEAMAGLTGAAQDYLAEAKDYFASSADYIAIFDSVNASLQSADVKATSQIDLMRAQATWLEDIAGSNLEIAKALSDFVTAQNTLNSTRSWGLMADQNKAIWSDLNAKGINYSGNFGSGQFLDWVASQAPSMQAVIRPIIDKGVPPTHRRRRPRARGRRPSRRRPARSARRPSRRCRCRR
ncbi:M15 family metallopeptidase [Aureimonas sp. Leaf324]|jgi:hypothetical protein|uniref:M15 family metallopeptidase n=1 Tax=Aureimonas sp. Leaf324 TaxID=1736336 RepID=UPI0006F1F47F|nr:M15 family metallopeptidase [Aureimonas sp. Leaf324]KQQ85072.1 hypothetical protein ASF65_19850 [Aureimonas sp. Leaf324]